MTSSDLLTSDDLDVLAEVAFAADDPLPVAAQLADAAEHGLLADPADIVYALTLAAQVTEHADDIHAAEALAARAVHAHHTHGDPDDGWPHALHARLLLRLGHTEAAMAELVGIRRLLVSDPDAVDYITEALEDGGKPEIAVKWLTAALETIIETADTWKQPAFDHDQADHQQTMEVLLSLAEHRHRLRQDLELPHDRLDDLADRLGDTLADSITGDDPYEDYHEHGPISVLRWPHADYEEVLARWPSLAQVYGPTWDDYRRTLECALTGWSQTGHTGLTLLAGSAEQLAVYAHRHAGQPTDPAIRQGYAQHLNEHPHETAWPPGRNDPCWCGSATKYKKCCRPLSQPH